MLRCEGDGAVVVAVRERQKVKEREGRSLYT